MTKSCIILQGLNTYLPELETCYGSSNKGKDDIVFSGWLSENNNLSKVFTNSVFTSPPSVPGYGNSHLQFVGAAIGCATAMTLGFEYALKMRADLIIKDYKKLLTLLNPTKLCTLAFHNYNGGYLIDYMIGGPIKLLFDIFNKDTSDSPDFAERQLFNRIKDKGITEVQYLLPLMKENNISCYSLKWGRDIIESGSVDSLYTYPLTI